jgi:hypothetical protein
LVFIQHRREDVKTLRYLLPLLVVTLIFTACGYHNPNVYSGPDKAIYMAEWKNRTSEMGLDSKIYRTLTRWFQYSKSISTVRVKEGADLVLAGEIISIELPSLSYGAGNVATEVKVRLRIRYILKEIASGKIILEVGDETWTEEYLVSANSSQNLDNEAAALDRIVENLSQKIYQRTVAELPKL